MRGRLTRRSILALGVLAAAVTLFFLPVGQVVSQAIQQVVVTNFPEVFRIEGEVTVDAPVMLSRMVPFEGVIVPPVAPTETTDLVDGGTLVTNGFPNVVLSLHGQVKGQVQQPGTIGAFLIPDEIPIQQAFDELGLVHFALEVSASGIRPGTAYIASTQPRYVVAFTSYKIYFYNTTDKTITANLYAYLTN